ncbi:hypothetical protein Chor_014247 [Crotalus horridus]
MPEGGGSGKRYGDDDDNDDSRAREWGGRSRDDGGGEFKYFPIDKRIESEESGDDEGKKQAVCIVTDLSQQSLKEEQNGDNLTGESEIPVDMETISLDPEAEDVDLNHFRIGKIEGFEVLKKVKTLCLRQNLIKCIENLEQLQTLKELDLYDNQVRKIENLEALTGLE